MQLGAGAITSSFTRNCHPAQSFCLLLIELGGKPKWLPLNFEDHDVMRHRPHLTSLKGSVVSLRKITMLSFSTSFLSDHTDGMSKYSYKDHKKKINKKTARNNEEWSVVLLPLFFAIFYLSFSRYYDPRH